MLICLAILAVVAGAPLAPQTPTAEFVVATESEATAPSFGMLMISPAYAYGTPDDAERKLKGMLEARKDTPAPPSTIWVCRVDFARTLRRFAPLVDRTIVNPALTISESAHAAASGSEPLWPGCEHPLLLNMCNVRRSGGTGRLLACINVTGEPILYGGRKASFEEIKWQALAAVGADFKGLIWRGEPAVGSCASRLREFESSLRTHAADLGAARPVEWVEAPQGQPVSAMASDRRLFVVLVNSTLLRTVERKQQKLVQLPLEDPVAFGRLNIRLPAGVSAANARTLGGRRLELKPGGDRRLAVDYRFEGAGDMIVVDLAGGALNPAPPRPVSAAQAGGAAAR